MRKFPFVVLVALLSAAAAAKIPPASSATRLAPEPQQVLIARVLVEVTQAKHYPDKPLDATLAHAILDQYFDDLDPGRYFFTQAAIDGFHKKYDQKLATDLKHGDLEPGFAIYRYYLSQARKRIDYAMQLLDHEPDFDGKATFRFARRNAPWPADSAAMNQLWKERVANDALTLILAGKTWKQAKATLIKRYRYALNDVSKTTSEDVFDAYLNAYTETQDPHSSYFSPFQAQQFQIEMSLQFEGIGAELTERDDYATITRILPGGPAAKNGELKPGDRIVGVGEGKEGAMVDVVGWRLDDIVKKIRGPKGSSVRLKILPAGALPGGPEKTLTLVRNTVELEAERAKAKTMIVRHGTVAYRIGVITIPSFYVNFQAEGDGDKNYTSVTRDVRALIEELKRRNVSGLLLDLRNNGGGSLEEAAALTGLFIPHGPVVQVEERSGRAQVIDTPKGEATAWNGPLAVLVNRFSASATEIFAGALKDYDRALILGSRTWGKGTVQQLVDLDDYLPGFKAGELKLTEAQFFRVTGSSTQHRGVLPDIGLPSPINDKEFGEDSYPNALPWRSIPAAQYTPLEDGLDSLLPTIRKYFQDTVRTTPQFQLYERQVAEQRKADAQTTLPLNLAARRQESDAQRARALELDNAWRKLHGQPAFKNLKAAGDADFSPPDVPLDAGADLLGEYIDLAPPVVADFKSIITTVPDAANSCIINAATGARPSYCDKKSARDTQTILPPGAQSGG